MSVAYRMDTAQEYDVGQYETERREYEATRARKQRHSAFALVMRRAAALFAAVCIAAVCVGLLYVKSQVYCMQLDVNRLVVEIEQAERKTSMLNEQYNESANIHVIMERAEELGMAYPDPQNVLYVDMGRDTSIKNNR